MIYWRRIVAASLLIPILLSVAPAPFGGTGSGVGVPRSALPAGLPLGALRPTDAPRTASARSPHVARIVEVSRPALPAMGPLMHPANPPSTVPAVASSPQLGAGWVGLSSADNRYWGQPPLSPPDVQVAVGPSHVMEMVNLVWSVWGKAGTFVSNGSLPVFFGTGSDFISDPKVQYDAPSQRWFASITDVTKNSTVLAVSAGIDPTRAWHRWSFGSAACYDQPILGVATSVVILSANLFSSCTSSSGVYLGAEYWVILKSDLLSGAAAPKNQTFGPYPLWSSIHPAQILGSSSVAYLVSANWSCATCFYGNQILYFVVHGVPPLATFTWTSLAVGTVIVPPSAPQSGTADTIDTGDIRVQDAVWSAGNLWLGLNTECMPSGDASFRACVRLVEIDTTSGRVSQDFNVAQAGQYFFYPALRTDGSGDLLVTFGSSNAQTYPSLLATGRVYGDSAGTVQAPKLIHQGTAPAASGCGSSGVCRYGDYFGGGVDPSNGSLLWLAGENGASSRLWSTYVFSASVKAILTFDYVIRGGGTGYAIPTVSYVSNGALVTTPLTTSPTAYYADPGSSWSVTPVIVNHAAQGEYWGLNTLVLNPPYSGAANASLIANYTYFHQFSVRLGYDVRGWNASYALPQASVSVTRFGQATTVFAGVLYILDAGTGYTYENPLGISTSTDRVASAGPVAGTVTGALDITVHYYHQDLMTFDYLVRAGAAALPPAVHYVSYGANSSVTANATVWADVGTPYAFPEALTGESGGVRTGAGPGAAGNVTSPGVVTVLYQTQYYLAISVEPGSLAGSVSGGGWYDAGSLATVRAIAPSGWKFAGWWQGAASQPNATLSLQMAGPANLTAVYFAGLTITAGDGGSVSYSYGTVSGTVPAGSSTTIYVMPGTAVTLTATPASWADTFGGWSGAANTATPNAIMTVDGPAAVSASFLPNTLLLAGAIGGPLAVVVAAILVVLLVRRRKKSPPTGPA